MYVALNSEGLAAQVSHLSYNLELARRTVRKSNAHDALVIMYPVHVACTTSRRRRLRGWRMRAQLSLCVTFFMFKLMS